MKTITRTLCLRLGRNKEIEETLLAYASVLNRASRYAFEHKVWDSLRIHGALYRQCREELGLKAQMCCSAFRQVAATYNSQIKKVKEGRRRSLHVFAPSSMTLQYGRDWGLKEGRCVSVSTLGGRVQLSYPVSPYQEQYLDGSWHFGAAVLINRGGTLFLHVLCEKDTSAKIPVPNNIIGIDLGMTNLAVATNKEQEAVFIGGGKVKNHHRKNQKVIASLKAKGTSSARRRLRKRAGKQHRYQKDINHCASKEIVKFATWSGASILALEDLTNIRRSSLRKSARSSFHSWGFYQLRKFISYKAEAVGAQVVLVNAAYTSQGCSRCGHTEKANRYQSSFKCKACGYSLHSDLNAARNIADRARQCRQVLHCQGPINDPLMLRPLTRDDTGEASEQVVAPNATTVD